MSAWVLGVYSGLLQWISAHPSVPLVALAVQASVVLLLAVAVTVCCVKWRRAEESKVAAVMTVQEEMRDQYMPMITAFREERTRLLAYLEETFRAFNVARSRRPGTVKDHRPFIEQVMVWTREEHDRQNADVRDILGTQVLRTVSEEGMTDDSLLALMPRETFDTPVRRMLRELQANGQPGHDLIRHTLAITETPVETAH